MNRSFKMNYHPLAGQPLYVHIPASSQPENMPADFPALKLAPPMQTANERRPAPVPNDEASLAENLRSMSMAPNAYPSNMNNSYAEPSMSQDNYKPPYDLFAQYDQFPLLDNSLIHNNEGNAPALFQSNIPIINGGTCDNVKKNSKSASAQKTYSAALSHSFFSDQNKQRKPADAFSKERLMTNLKPECQDESGYRLSDSDFPSLPLTHHPNFTGSRSSLPPIGTKQQTYKSSVGSGLNRLDGMSNDEKIIDEDSENAMSDCIRPNGYQDRFGMLGILAYMKGLQSGVPNLSALTQGYPLATLNKHLGFQYRINPTNAGPFAKNPIETHNEDFHIPPEYKIQHKIAGALPPVNMSRYKEDLLFFLFYQFPGEKIQVDAANELRVRNWRFHKRLNQWIRYSNDHVVIASSATHERAICTKFDSILWKKYRQEIILELEQFEQPHEYQL